MEITALKNDPSIHRIAVGGQYRSFGSCWTPVCSTNCICSSTRYRRVGAQAV